MPELLEQKHFQGQWVLYHGKERVGVAISERILIEEALHRGLRSDEYYTDRIVPRAQAPWEVEDITPGRWPAEQDNPRPTTTAMP